MLVYTPTKINIGKVLLPSNLVFYCYNTYHHNLYPQESNDYILIYFTSFLIFMMNHKPAHKLIKTTQL